MNVVHDDETTVEVLDDAGMSFMALSVDRLNQALKSNGISDVRLRQEICASFLFDFAYSVDAGWFMQGESKLFPKVCFADRDSSSEGGALGEVNTLFVPTAATSWHEYAHGVVSQYFQEDGESVPGVRTGSYDE